LRVVWKRLGLAAGVVVAVLIAAALAAACRVRGEIRASLPLLDGELALAGLGAPLTIERDARGVATIRAEDETDLVRATGFLHAQDRFFQMDLLRRSAAGELAALVGGAALELDRRLRVHRFRARAGAMLARASSSGRRSLEAYASGVNAGLSALGGKPFEYLLLRAEPEPWRPEDTTLVSLAMFLDLQDGNGSLESSLGLMHDLLPEALFDFLTPAGTEWDAPLDGSTIEPAPVPGPEVVDLRTMAPWSELARQPSEPSAGVPASLPPRGSNNWALAGSLSAHGGALLANDMHLGLAVPNIWYRLSSIRTDSSGAELRVTGVTLPGTPGIVAGSNGHVAWGYTNSYADWSDLVVVEVDPASPDRYRTPDGWRRFETHRERLRVNSCAAALACNGIVDAGAVEVRETIWGPVVDSDHLGRPRALRWVAHEADAVNLDLLELAAARDLDAALAIATRAGIPGQNVAVADRSGRIGWTIMGRLPRRTGFDGRLPGSWADGSRRWDGWLDPGDYPRVVDPPEGRLWTANARVGGREYLERVGDGGFALGARASQIRDDLRALRRASEHDLLGVQLDDRAVFLERWHRFLLALLDERAVAGNESRTEFRRLLAETWTGRASIDSNAYRFVRAFRQFLAQEVFDTITLPCRRADPAFEYFYRQSEGPLWAIVTARPPNLLHPAYDGWEAWLLAVVDRTIDYYLKDGGTLAERTWGQRNTVRIAHPLSLAAPWIGRLLDLDMPREPLPGDQHMPRVQGRSVGASERMVVSPGREQDGIFHMPGGQSGHPMSPFYRAGHRDWAEGRPSPFLPGETRYVLRLVPAR